MVLLHVPVLCVVLSMVLFYYISIFSDLFVKVFCLTHLIGPCVGTLDFINRFRSKTDRDFLVTRCNNTLTGLLEEPGEETNLKMVMPRRQ